MSNYASLTQKHSYGRDMDYIRDDYGDDYDDILSADIYNGGEDSSVGYYERPSYQDDPHQYKESNPSENGGAFDFMMKGLSGWSNR